MKRVLLTGGLGYIGSHTAVALADAGQSVVLFDNLSNSKCNVLDRLETITGTRFPFIKGDVRDTALLEETLQNQQIDAIVHFAGLKAVGESVETPLSYYENNVVGTVSLLRAMTTVGLTSLVYSSSATVYGDPDYVPIDESHPRSATNPYGQTKLHIEDMLRDLANSDPRWSIACLRYFNPVGGHESGLIGEVPNGVPNNLMPYITQVVRGIRNKLLIYGNDYETDDGTGTRDYIHVVDLAEGHLSALKSYKSAINIYNLGTGKGTSVLELVNAFMNTNQVKISYEISERRSGDIAISYADGSKAKNELNWEAKLTIEDMVRDSWNFEKNMNKYI